MWGRTGWHRSAVIQPSWDEGVEYLCFCARKIFTFTSCLRWKKHQYSSNLKSLSTWKPKLEPIVLKYCAKMAWANRGIHKSHWEQNWFPLICHFSLCQKVLSDIFSKGNSSFSNVWSVSWTSGFSILLDSFYSFILYRTTLVHNILYLYLLCRPKASWNVGMKALRVKVRFFSSAGKTTLCNILLVATTFEQICHTGCSVLARLGSPCSHDLKPKLALQHCFPPNFYCIYLVLFLPRLTECVCVHLCVLVIPPSPLRVHTVHPATKQMRFTACSHGLRPTHAHSCILSPAKWWSSFSSIIINCFIDYCPSPESVSPAFV